MRISSASLLAVLLIASIARPAEADWITDAQLFAPIGISANRDRVLVFGNFGMIDFASDGKARSGKSYEANDGRLQFERVINAREGFIICGVLITGDHESYEPTVIRLNAAGEVQWARSIDALWLSGMTVAAETTDGSIVVATKTLDEMLLVKFSANGETKWRRLLDRTDTEGIRALVPTREGGVLVVTSALGRAGALTRIDAAGKVVWDRVLGSAEAGFGLYDARELPDGGFIAVGRLRVFSTSNREGWLVGLSPRGEVRWQKTFGGDGEDGLYAIARLGANEYAAIGGTASAGAGDVDTWIMTVDAKGVVSREFAVGDADDSGPRDPTYAVVAESADGEIVFASPTSPLTVSVGRIRTSSGACKLVRAIHTPQQDATAFSIESALIESDVTPAIRPIEVSIRSFTTDVKPVCQWTGTDTPAVVQSIAVEPRGEEALFADEIAQLLIQRKYRALDELATALGHSAFDSGRSKLRAFYAALGQHTSLVSLGEEHRRLLEGWRAATDGATSRIALASERLASAERIRGTGAFNSLLDAEADRYRRYTGQALALLSEAEEAGKCDAPCYELQIDTAKLGGWSEPLKKLHALAPEYWEAFAAATVYLGENWGGRPGAIAEFVQSEASQTKDALGNALYALHYARWQFGIGAQPVPPPPDWPRMRSGFRDFQRLHPKSRRNAHMFAAAAYRVARDRDAARALFKTPLLEWSAAANAWDDRLEYERAKAWALSEPIEPFVGKLEDAARRLVARESGKPHSFLVATPSGPVGITLAARSLARFTPSPQLAAALHPLTRRTTPIATGDRLFIIACRGDGQDCVPRVIEARAIGASPGFSFALPDGSNPDDPESLAGAPALDDDGAVAGVVLPYVPGVSPMIRAIDP